MEGPQPPALERSAFCYCERPRLWSSIRAATELTPRGPGTGEGPRLDCWCFYPGGSLPAPQTLKLPQNRWLPSVSDVCHRDWLSGKVLGRHQGCSHPQAGSMWGLWAMGSEVLGAPERLRAPHKRAHAGCPQLNTSSSSEGGLFIVIQVPREGHPELSNWRGLRAHMGSSRRPGVVLSNPPAMPCPTLPHQRTLTPCQAFGGQV